MHDKEQQQLWSSSNTTNQLPIAMPVASPPAPATVEPPLPNIHAVDKAELASDATSTDGLYGVSSVTDSAVLSDVMQQSPAAPTPSAVDSSQV